MTTTLHQAGLLAIVTLVLGCGPEPEVELVPQPELEHASFDETEGIRASQAGMSSDEYEASEAAKGAAFFVNIDAHKGLKAVQSYSMVKLNADVCSVDFSLTTGEEAADGEESDAETIVGGFGYPEGRIRISDQEKITALNLKVLARSLWTTTPKLAATYKQAEYLNANEFPDIEFSSTAVEGGVEGVYTMTGDLTVRGMTKQVSLAVLKGLNRNGMTLTSDLKIDLLDFEITTESLPIDITFTIGKASGPR